MLGKQEDLNLNHQHQCNKQKQNKNKNKLDTLGMPQTLVLAVRDRWMLRTKNFQFCGRPYLKGIRQRVSQQNTQHPPLASMDVCTSTCNFTQHMHKHKQMYMSQKKHTNFIRWPKSTQWPWHTGRQT